MVGLFTLASPLPFALLSLAYLPLLHGSVSISGKTPSFLQTGWSVPVSASRSPSLTPTALQLPSTASSQVLLAEAHLDTSALLFPGSYNLLSPLQRELRRDSHSLRCQTTSANGDFCLQGEGGSWMGKEVKTFPLEAPRRGWKEAGTELCSVYGSNAWAVGSPTVHQSSPFQWVSDSDILGVDAQEGPCPLTRSQLKRTNWK